MQITISKKYLILVEVSENIFRAFLVIVNFVFDVVEEKIEEVKNKVSNAFNFIRALFGFNIFKIEIIKSIYRILFTIKKNNSFLIYSNLLAPPASIL
jgi:hypothetical protein